MALLRRVPFEYVTARPDPKEPGALGHIRWRPARHRNVEAATDAMVATLLAGPIAEVTISRAPPYGYSDCDFATVNAPPDTVPIADIKSGKPWISQGASDYDIALFLSGADEVGDTLWVPDTAFARLQAIATATRRSLLRHWLSVSALANELVARKRVTYDEAKAIHRAMREKAPRR